MPYGRQVLDIDTGHDGAVARSTAVAADADGTTRMEARSASATAANMRNRRGNLLTSAD